MLSCAGVDLKVSRVGPTVGLGEAYVIIHCCLGPLEPTIFLHGTASAPGVNQKNLACTRSAAGAVGPAVPRGAWTSG